MRSGDNSKVYAEYGPDGKYDGRCLVRVCCYPTTGCRRTTVYSRYERGKEKERGKVKAWVKDHAYVDGAEDDGEYDWRFGRCKYKYNGEDCASEDPRLLALIAHVAPVEVRPAAAAPSPPRPLTRRGPLPAIAAHSPPSNRPMDQPARFPPAGAGDRHGR
jgi:hypothetical protein